MNKEFKQTLLEIFPKHDKIDIKKIDELLENCYDACPHYQDIYKYFIDYVDNCFPGSDYKKYPYGTPANKEYTLYKWGEGSEMTISRWIDKVTDIFIIENGQRRTLEEACKIATEKWCDYLFKRHVQDNGAMNENHGGGFWACALGTVLKDKHMGDITAEMIQKAYNNIYEYLLNGSIYKDEDYKFKIDLYCDYCPNAPLDKCLSDAGIPEAAIRNICPWKTGVQIDYLDNAVMLIGYQKCDYI